MLKPCLSFCLLYSEICSYSYVLDNDFERIPHGFSSPIFGDMFLLQNGTFFDWGDEDEFSSPIFGGMFLLNYLIILSLIMKRFRLLYSEICSYLLTFEQIFDEQAKVFSSPIFGDMFLLTRTSYKIYKYRTLFLSPIFGDMFLLDEISYRVFKNNLFSSPIFGDMFLLII